MTSKLSRTVLALGFVSFLTDFSSEMIYPLLPVFLTTVLAAGPRALGAIEGVAESTASLVKLASGLWSDRVKRRKPLVLAGYALAGAVRPLVGLATVWPTVLAIRFFDRVGKGLRSSPRDALIADVTPPAILGHAYGVQRSLDHAGAVVGPLVAAVLLATGVSLRNVFLLAAIPAAVVVLVLTFGVAEPERKMRARPDSESAGRLGRPFRVFLFAVLVFTLGNSSDAFLLLRLSSAGMTAASVAALWSVFHVVKMLASYAGGALSDRLGRRSLMVLGWCVYAGVYASFGLVTTPATLAATLLVYGLYFGLTEPVERAWVAEMAPAHLKGTAFGYYHGTVGLAALPASLLFGALWYAFGPTAAFFTGAGLSLAAAMVLFSSDLSRKSFSES